MVYFDPGTHRLIRVPVTAFATHKAELLAGFTPVRTDNHISQPEFLQ